MKNKHLVSKLALVCALLAVSSAPMGAAILSTLFAANNGGSLGGAVYFDLTTFGNSIEITGLTLNTAETVPFTLSVYTKSGTAAGSQTNPLAWTLAATGAGTGLGLNNATPVTLLTSILLAPSSTYGIALDLGPTAGHDYTNGNGSNQSYSNADLALSFGSATNVAFTGFVFSPRVWNGSIEYDVVTANPEPSTFALMGIGAVLLAALRRKGPF